MPGESDPQMKEFLDKASEVQLPKFSHSKEELWSRIDERTGSKSKPYYWAAAAVIILAIMGIWMVSFLSADEQVDVMVGQSKVVDLPDGSSVSLNAVSTLVYDQDWEERTVTLKGEAFFEVQKGENFRVQTSIGIIEVLGTSFNVLARPNQFAVECKTGSVRVSVSKLSFQAILEPGDRVLLDSGKIISSTLDTKIIGSWGNGEFYFDNRPVTEVLEEVERQFDISLETQGLDNTRFSGYFSNKDLQTALTMICEPLDLAYAIISDDQVDVRNRQEAE